MRDDDDDERRPVGQRCPRCKKGFQVLADEAGQHACPHCGYEPHEKDSEPSDEDA